MEFACIACGGQGCSLCGESRSDDSCAALADYCEERAAGTDPTRVILRNCYYRAAFFGLRVLLAEGYCNSDLLLQPLSDVVLDDTSEMEQFATTWNCKACNGIGCGLCKCLALPAGTGDCAVCLGTSEDSPVRLHCGHDFCLSCLRKHVASQIRGRRTPWCPLCRESLDRTEIEAICPGEFAKWVDRGNVGDDEDTVPVPRNRRAERIFRRTARQQHLKKCPACESPIQKNGGCDHMNCTCGHRFNWSEAPTVVPCHRVHLDPKRKVPVWCRTCPTCSPIAKVKLAGVRAGVVVAAPIGAVIGTGLVVAGATTVATGTALTIAVPAVVCAPLAAAYEPIRRVRGRDKPNPFARGMGAGVRALSRFGASFCDSD